LAVPRRCLNEKFLLDAEIYLVPLVPRATCSNAACSEAGSDFPRFSARRRMPAQAFAEREYFGAAFGSRIEAREQAEDPSAALGHSEPLSIKSSPCSMIPDFVHLTEDSPEVPATVAREQSGHILEKAVSRFEFINYPCCFVEQAGTTASQTGSLSRNAQVLARETESHHIARREVVRPSRADIIQCHGIWPFGSQQLAALGILLDVADDAESRMVEAKVEASDPSEEGDYGWLNIEAHLPRLLSLHSARRIIKSVIVAAQLVAVSLFGVPRGSI